jgi:signal transduction histidine kinase
MRLLRFERARTRLALSGAVVSAAFLIALALGARVLIRRMAFQEIDGELDTLATAIGSDYELVGLPEEERQALKAGLEANAFEFRLANHSAILFNGEVPVALTGNLLPEQTRVTLAPYRNKPEIPYTAVETYSSQNRVCRFLVTQLQGKAKGATLVLFRWIGPTMRGLSRVDRALAGMVLVGFLGTATILAFAVHRAIRPVEEVTRLAEEAEATDLSRRVRVSSGGEEFRRLANVINSLFERLERAFAAQRRLISDAAHELKTPTAVLLGEASDALRPEATESERQRSLQTIAEVSRGLAREVDGLLHLARGDAAAPRRMEPIDLSEITEEAIFAAAALGHKRGVVCAFSRNGEAKLRGERAGLLRLVSNLVSNAVLYTAPDTMVEVRVGSGEGRVFVDVADRGPGIAPDDRSRIFERFVRLDDARARNPQGSGLGLAIVEQVVAAHGGSIEVREHEGGGAVFRVTLPERVS